jgi:glycerol-3-phosphate dehydrogenase
MRRDVSRLESETFDLLVVGGGIHGATIAWDACLRGLRVALVEQRDFCSGTTANSLRIVHGGLRAIQQFAVGSLRQSAREQAILIRIAPSYVQPLPCLVPIYRSSTTGITAFRAALASARVLTADISRSFNAPLPAPRIVSADEAFSCFDGFDSGDLAGGALWYDAQVPDIERLVLAFIRSAEEKGVAAANYVRARRLIVESGSVRGAEVTDQRTGHDFRVRARVVVNAAGPWALEFAESARASDSAPLPRHWAQGVNLVINRPPPAVAIGIRSPWGMERDPVMGGHRFLFMTAWKGATLAGTSYRFATGDGPSLPVHARELLEEWNAACPSLGWQASDISHYHCGRLPLRAGFQSGRPTALLDHSAVVEHVRSGLAGFVSVVGTKFTTARRLAEAVVDTLLPVLGKAHVKSLTSASPLAPETATGASLDARVRRAIHDEMALSLEDVVIRRLGLGLTSCPPMEVLGQIADTVAEELGWTDRQTDGEVKQLLGRFYPGGITRAA